MRRANYIIQILLLIVGLAAFSGTLAFGHGLGDGFYALFAVGASLFLFLLTRKFPKSQSLFLLLGSITLLLFCLKASIWRGPEYRWNGTFIIGKTKGMPDPSKGIAIDACKQALQTEPENDSLRLALMTLLRSAGRCEESVRLIQHNSHMADIYIEQADCFFILDRKDHAMKALHKALLVDSSNTRLKSRIEYLNSN